MSNPYEDPSARQEPYPKRMSAAEILGHVQPQPMTQATTSIARKGFSWVTALVVAGAVVVLLGGAYLILGSTSSTEEPAAPLMPSEVRESPTKETARATSIVPRPSTESVAPPAFPTSKTAPEPAGGSWGSPRN